MADRLPYLPGRTLDQIRQWVLGNRDNQTRRTARTTGSAVSQPVMPNPDPNRVARAGRWKRKKGKR